MFEKPINQINDEIDLLDVIRQLWEGKVIIIIMSALFLLITGIGLIVSTPTWTSKSIISMPHLGQLASYPNAVALSQGKNLSNLEVDSIINNVFNNFIMRINARILSEMPKKYITVVPGVSPGSFIVSLSYTSVDKNLAQEKLNNLLDELNRATEKDLYSTINRALQERIVNLHSIIKAQENSEMERQADRLILLKNTLDIAQKFGIQYNQISRVPNQLPNDLLFMLGVPTLTMMINQKYKWPSNFDNEYYRNKEMLEAVKDFKLSDNNFFAFNYIQKPLTPSNESSTKQVLSLILALFFGIIISCSYILLRNVMRNKG